MEIPSFYKLHGDTVSQDTLALGERVEGSLAIGSSIDKGATQKFTATVSISDDAERLRFHGHFIIRQYASASSTQAELIIAKAQAIADLYSATKARRAGLPVPDVIRYFDTTDGIPSLLVSDVTAGGTRKIWSPHHDSIEALHKFELLPASIAKLSSDAFMIARAATEDRLIVSLRGYSLVECHQGNPAVCIIDFGDGLIDATANERLLPNLLERNEEHARNFVYRLVDGM